MRLTKCLAYAYFLGNYEGSYAYRLIKKRVSFGDLEYSILSELDELFVWYGICMVCMFYFFTI